MRTLSLGVLASVLSATTALIIVHTAADGTHPLYLLFAQYLVGVVFSPPRTFPVAPIKLHLLRLVTGLWAFGGYYLALSLPEARPAELSMVLNTAPVFATFYAVRNPKTRLGALLAFGGVALSFLSQNEMSGLSSTHFIVLTSAGAYAASFILLGVLSQAGEASLTTNSLYNAMAGILIASVLCLVQPPLPLNWWPVFAVGAIAAARIQVLTFAAVNPEESARISVLTSLAFVWLVIAEVLSGKTHCLLEWGALSCVIAGVVFGSRIDNLRHVLSRFISIFLREKC